MTASIYTRTEITAEQEYDLVALVRTTETAEITDPATGNITTRYFPTYKQEDALNTLLAAYDSDIHKAARTSKRVKIDRSLLDDAVSVARMKFIDLVRSTNRTNERLAGFVSRAMVNAVNDYDAEDMQIRVPADTRRIYFNLVREHGSVDAAYQFCKDNNNNFSAITFLAVNRAVNAESMDAVSHNKTSGDSEGAEFKAFEGAFNADRRDSLSASTSGSHGTPSHEDAIVQTDLVNYLFTKVNDEQETVLRLAHGFEDTRSENLRLQGGYQFDALLSDKQISPVLGLSTATVNRRRNEGLRTMREVMKSVLNEGDEA